MIAIGLSRPLGPVRYRVFRRFIRMGMAVFYGKMRVLGAERVPATGAALLAINHPSDFIGPLVLVAALERRVRCFVSRQSFRGTWAKLLAWGLGLTPYNSESKAGRRGTEHGSEILAGGDAVALFLEGDSAPASAASEFFRRAASLALAAEALRAAQGGLAVLPVHLFLPGKPLKSKETLVYVERPLDLESLFQDPRSLAERTRALSEVLAEASRRNVFRLQPKDLAFLLAGLEEVLRSDLEEEWAARPSWKQKVDGFGLSGYVKKWAEQMNFFEPARLVALRESLLDYRERRRSFSLRRLKVDTAGRWVSSLWRRAAVWFESVGAFPVALYGLVNHLLVAVVLRAAGVLRKETSIDRTARWMTIGLALGFWYLIQILACEHWLGRAAAGYYALTLPFSGVYAYRYFRLLRHETRTLWLRLRGPHDARSLVRSRKLLVRELVAGRDRSLEALRLST